MTDTDEEEEEKDGDKPTLGYGLMNADVLRKTAEKYSGRTDLLPEDMDDPELLLRGLVRKYDGELKAAAKRTNIAEHQASSLKKRVTMLQESYDEAQSTVDKATRELKTAQREIQDYQMKIAFLGNRWEKLTGVPNEELVRDANSQAKRYKGELRTVKSELFVSKLTQRTLEKEIAVWKSTLDENEGRQTHLYTELVDTRLKDQDLEQNIIRVQHLQERSDRSLLDEKAVVTKKTGQIVKLDRRVKVLAEETSEARREKERAERAALSLKKQIVGHADEVAAIEAKTRQSAEVAAVLEKRCKEQEVIVKEQSSVIEVIRAEVAEEKRWNAVQQKKIVELEDEIEKVKIERNLFTDMSKKFEKTGMLNGRRAREFEEEAQALASNVAGSSTNLVRVTHELSDERKKVKECQKLIIEYKTELKEYRKVAAERKNRLEDTESRLEQAVAQAKEVEAREYGVKRDLRKTEISLRESLTNEKESAAEVVRVAASLQASQNEYKLLQQEVKRLHGVIADLEKSHVEQKATTKTYRNKSEMLEGQLDTTKQRVQASEEHAYSLRVDRDSFSGKYSTELSNVAALGGQVEIMVNQLRQLELDAIRAQKREDDLHDEIKKLKEKLKDERERGDSYAAGQAVAEGERDVYKGKSIQHAEDAAGKKRTLRKTQSDLKERNTDLHGIKDSYDQLTQQLLQSKTINAEQEAEISRLTKDLTSTSSKLKHEESESKRLAEELQATQEAIVELEATQEAIVELEEHRREATQEAIVELEATQGAIVELEATQEAIVEMEATQEAIVELEAPPMMNEAVVSLAELEAEELEEELQLELQQEEHQDQFEGLQVVKNWEAENGLAYFYFVFSESLRPEPRFDERPVMVEQRRRGHLVWVGEVRLFNDDQAKQPGGYGRQARACQERLDIQPGDCFLVPGVTPDDFLQPHSFDQTLQIFTHQESHLA